MAGGRTATHDGGDELIGEKGRAYGRAAAHIEAT